MNEERRDMNDGILRKKARTENSTTNSPIEQESRNSPTSLQNKSIKTILTSYLNIPTITDSSNQEIGNCPETKNPPSYKKKATRQKTMTEFFSSLSPHIFLGSETQAPTTSQSEATNPVSTKFFAIKSKKQKHSAFEADKEIRQSLHNLSVVLPTVNFHLIHELPDCKSQGCEETYSDFVVYLDVIPDQKEDSLPWANPKLMNNMSTLNSQQCSKSKLVFEPLPYLPADHAIFCRLNTFRQEESLFLGSSIDRIQVNRCSINSKRLNDKMKIECNKDNIKRKRGRPRKIPRILLQKNNDKLEDEESNAIGHSNSQLISGEGDEKKTILDDFTYCESDPLSSFKTLSKHNFCRHINDPEHFDYAHALHPITYRRKLSQIEYIRRKYVWLQEPKPSLKNTLNPPITPINTKTQNENNENNSQTKKPKKHRRKRTNKMVLIPKAKNSNQRTESLTTKGIENYQPFSFDVTFTSFAERKVPNFIEQHSFFLKNGKPLPFPYHDLLQPTHKYSRFVSTRKCEHKSKKLSEQDSEYVLRWLLEPPFCDSNWIIVNKILEKYFISTPIMLSKLRSNCAVIGSGASAVVFKAIAKVGDIPNMKENEKFINSIKQQKSNNFSDSDEISFADPKIVTSTSSETRNVYLAIKDFKNNCPHNYFLNELEVFALLTPHSCIVDFYGFVYDPLENTRILFMEFCELGSLFDILHGAGDRLQTRNTNDQVPTKLRFEAKLIQNRSKIALQIARAVQLLHSFGFVHIDLTSRNVLLTNTFDAKLTDFGLASKLYEGIGTRQPNHGPSYWKAPEIAKRNMKVAAGIVNQQHNDILSLKQNTSTNSDLDKQEGTQTSVPKKSTIEVYYTSAVDIFSYAIILWELFHLGMFPWNGQLDLCERLQLGMRPEIHHNVPLFWEEIIVRCWAQEPEKRPKAHEIVDKILEQEFC